MAESPKRITLALPRGMRDHLPDQLQARLGVIEIMRRIFELYGFAPLETPAMERLDVLTGKYGEEGEKLSFRVMKRGAELERALEKVKSSEAGPDELADLGLRYDLTVPLARVVAMYGDKLPRPFKRYQIAPVWRADRPQHGRYREFMQCDVDIVGTDSPLADAELIALMAGVFSELKSALAFPFDVIIHLNDRRLLAAMSDALGNPPEKFRDFCTVLDKLDKIGRDEIEKEMAQRGLGTRRLGELWELAEASVSWKIPAQMAGFVGNTSAIAELTMVLNQSAGFINEPDSKIRFDPTLARGLDYYTGPVFEVRAVGADMGSLGGGGRYDGLIGMFSKEPVSATGTSFGLERIADLLFESGKLKEGSLSAEVCILALDNSAAVIRRAGELRLELHSASLSAEIGYLAGDKLGRQIQTAVKRGNRFVAILGEQELSSDVFPLKRLSDGIQQTLTLKQAVAWIRETI